MPVRHWSDLAMIPVADEEAAGSAPDRRNRSKRLPTLLDLLPVSTAPTPRLRLLARLYAGLPLVPGLLGICWDYHRSDLLASTMADCADYPDDPPLQPAH